MKQVNIRAGLLERHTRYLFKDTPSHETIMCLLADRAEMSNTADVESTLELAKSAPGMLLAVRFAEHREHTRAKNRAAQESKRARKDTENWTRWQIHKTSVASDARVAIERLRSAPDDVLAAGWPTVARFVDMHSDEEE